MQVPSNLILGRIKRPAWYMCGCMGAWGALSAVTGTTQNFSGLVACRFFLGFLEAAFFPGISPFTKLQSTIHFVLMLHSLGAMVSRDMNRDPPVASR